MDPSQRHLYRNTAALGGAPEACQDSQERTRLELLFANGRRDVNDDKGQVPRVAASAALLAAYAVRTLFNEPLVV